MPLRLEVQVTPPPSFIRYEVSNDPLPKLLRNPSILTLPRQSVLSIRLRSASYKPGRIPDRTKRSETKATDPRSPRSTCTSPPYCQIRSCSAFSRLLESSYKNFAASCWFAFQLVRAAAVTRPSEPMMRGLSYLTGSLSLQQNTTFYMRRFGHGVRVVLNVLYLR